MKNKTRTTARRSHSERVVLDTVGMVRRRNGPATLRLKIVGPVDKLIGLQMHEGDHLRVHARTVAVA